MKRCDSALISEKKFKVLFFFFLPFVIKEDQLSHRIFSSLIKLIVYEFFYVAILNFKHAALNPEVFFPPG